MHSDGYFWSSEIRKETSLISTLASGQNTGQHWDSSLTAIAQILCLYATSYFSKQLWNVHSQNPIYDLQLLISVHPQLLNISLNDRTNSCSLRKQWLRDRHLHLWKGLLKKNWIFNQKATILHCKNSYCLQVTRKFFCLSQNCKSLHLH